MKKITTKKLAIAFVAIAFLFIFGFTAYRGLTGQFQSHPAVVKEVKKSTKKKTASTSKKTDAKSKSEKKTDIVEQKTETKTDTAQQKTETKKTDTASKSEQKSSVSSSREDTKKQEASQQETSQASTSTPQTPKQDTPVKQTVYIKVIGVNNTMMQGNIEVNSSSTAYSVLRELARENGKSISTKGFGSTVYVSGIDGLKEFDHGPSSGWMYKVNGTPPNIGAGAYKVKTGDTVIWYYVNVEQ